MTSIRDRVNEEVDRPFCNGRKVIPGKTSFKSLNLDLMEEWDYVSNLLLVDPDNVFDSSYKIAWWKCKDCGYKYPMSIANKTMQIKRKQVSCLKCKGFRRHVSHII